MLGEACEIIHRMWTEDEPVFHGEHYRIDGAIKRGFDEGGANALCALVIMVPRNLQGRGLSAAAVEGMASIARRHGLGSLIAPVRPSWKDRYPLVEIERYAQ